MKRLPLLVMHAWPESARSLAMLSGSVCLALIPHITHLPWWIPTTFIAAALWRLWLEIYAGALPNRWLRSVLAVLAMLAVAFNFRSVNGLEAGTALLSIMAGMKLLESRQLRDYTILIFIAFFLLFAALLYQQSLYMLPYLLACVVLCMALLLRMHAGTAVAPFDALQRSLRILLQALPLTVLLFLLVPRLPGQFWVLPTRDSATTGLSDEMNPGDIIDLMVSDDVAFRVQFQGQAPATEQLYWRAIVLHDFDGRTWRRSRGPMLGAPSVYAKTPQYHYRMLLEPSNQPWIPALDIPLQSNLRRGAMTTDLQLLSFRPIAQLTAVDIAAAPNYVLDPTLSLNARRLDTALPNNANPRSREFARAQRRAAANDTAYIDNILRMIRNEDFYYTLEPPALGADAIDDFLFTTRKGFCEHFASAFVFLMRAANIPARIVTGYQGGEYNPVSNYWIVRQSDAHAWAEVWLENRGWVRVDPTGAVATQRIERNLSERLTQARERSELKQVDISWVYQWQQNWDALNTFWKERIVNFDTAEQQSILNKFGLGGAGWRKLGGLLLLTFVGFFLVMMLYLSRQYRLTRQAPEVIIYAALKRKLAKHGIVAEPHEGPVDFLNRAATAKPDWSVLLHAVRDIYIALRYQPNPSAKQLNELRQLIKQLS